jgi:hypothetical protein
MRLAVVGVVVAVGVYVARSPRRVDASVLESDPSGPRLRVVAVADPNDSRLPAAREAVSYWNRQFLRLGLRVHFDSVVVRPDSISDDLLRAASGEVSFGLGSASKQVLAATANLPADVVIVLSHTDLISFSVRWRARSHGLVGIRRSDIPPLSYPNTVRNVIAHELGHVLGLNHNSDDKTLMCGRPASCRPIAFRSDSARFFPLTPEDEQLLQKRWP